MAKKYLLYIHDDLFEKEQKKSHLINNLLERHYHGRKTIANLEAPIKPPVVTSKNQSSRFCKHGYSVDARLCKFGCIK